MQAPDHLRPHELDALKRAGLVPIHFDAVRGCPGRCEDDEAPETLLDLCTSCSRIGIGDHAQFIEPRAVLSDGEWSCCERRAGGHGGGTVADATPSVESAVCGGSPGMVVARACEVRA